MINSIGKFTKSFFIKLLVAIIILPFIFWGMGDIFRGGNQNVLVTIGSEKLNTQDFINYVNRLNFTEDEYKNFKTNGILERILSDYVGKKIVSLEVEDYGIVISDNSLRENIKNDQTFFRDKKFSRTEYEKFLIENQLTAPTLEKNISEQEKKRQLLSFLSGGTKISKHLVQYEYGKNNQTKKIKLINLKEFYENMSFSEKDIQNTFQKNKSLFTDEIKIYDYIKLDPNIISDEKSEGDQFFKILDKIENNILDGADLKIIANENNLKILNTGKISFDLIKNRNEEQAGILLKLLSLKKNKKPEIFKFKNIYYVAEMKEIELKEKSLSDIGVKDSVIAQLKFSYKFENNRKIASELINNQNEYLTSFANKNNLKVQVLEIKDNNDKRFKKNILKKIFELRDGETGLITDSSLNDNFIIFCERTDYKKINENSENYKSYEAKAKLSLAQEIYSFYDLSLNEKYDIRINQKVLNRVKNSF